MSNEIYAYGFEDIKTNNMDNTSIDIEFFPHILINSDLVPYKSEIIEVFNLYISFLGIYRVLLLQSISEFNKETYQIVGYYNIIPFPYKSFFIQMIIDSTKKLISKIWVEKNKYIYYGIRDNSLVTITQSFPFSSKEFFESLNQKKNIIHLKQKIAELKYIVDVSISHIKNIIKLNDIPELLVSCINGFKTEQLDGEGELEYYCRLFNILYCLYFNVDCNSLLIIRDELKIIKHAIERTESDFKKSGIGI